MKVWLKNRRRVITRKVKDPDTGEKKTVRARSECFYAAYTHPATGKEVRRSLYTSDASLAQKRLRMVQREVETVLEREPVSGFRPIKVADLVPLYIKYVGTRYVNANGKPTTAYYNITRVARQLAEQYGQRPAQDFGPKALKELRLWWIRKGLARVTVKTYVGFAKQIFEWGVSEELVPAETYEALRSVKNLRRGELGVYETPPVQPVPWEDVETTLWVCPRPVMALAHLQRLTACRGSELFLLRRRDIDESNDVWTYRLAQHKNVHRGKTRTLYFGPKAQGIIRAFAADRSPSVYLFSPREALKEIDQPAPSRRCREQKETRSKTGRTIGEHYNKDSYAKAISRACQRTGVKHWTPHQIRHTAATEIEAAFGLEYARDFLGHATVSATQIYSAAALGNAMEVAQAQG